MSDTEDYVGAIDQGTTSTRFIIFDKNGKPIAMHQEEIEQFYPQPGWHEHSPSQILSSVQSCIRQTLSKVSFHISKSIRSIGITNQRETLIPINVRTGEALHNAIVWSDTRTSSLVSEIKTLLQNNLNNNDGSMTEEKLKAITGLNVSTYASVSKLLWLLTHGPSVKECYESGELGWTTIDSYLCMHLNISSSSSSFSSEKEKRLLHVTDVTNGSRTMLMDIHTLCWSEECLSFFSRFSGVDLRRVKFPEIVKSSDASAYGSVMAGPLTGTKITACLGDQSAAMLGHLAVEEGMAKNTYGTGCFLLCNIGDRPIISKNGLLTTIAYQLDSKPVYALEGSIAVAGSAIKFLTRNLGFGVTSEDISSLAEKVDDSGGVVFVTAFSGLFAPYWINDARGTIFGITSHTTSSHISRAVLEAVCHQTNAILEAIRLDCPHLPPLTSLKVDGGMSCSDVTMQIQADICGLEIIRSEMHETTSLGTAIASGFAVGVWKDIQDVKDCINNSKKTVDTIFNRRISNDQASIMKKRWEKAVKMSKGWSNDEE